MAPVPVNHKASKSTWLVLVGMWVPIALLGVVVAIKTRDPFVPVLWIPGGVALLAGVALSRVSIGWTEEEIWYRGPLQFRKLSFKYISDIQIATHQGPFGSPFTLELKSRDPSEPSLRINLKLFSTDTVRTLRRVLSESAGGEGR